MDAYDALDRPYAAKLNFDREDGNGDRLYTYPVRCEDAKSLPQEYFYRAMTRTEAMGWLSPGHNATVEANGHHPWASYRGYSLLYLSRTHGYAYLLEVHAPNFIPWMKEIGFTEGKTETGDISWGIGVRSSNAFGPSATTNVALKALYRQVHPLVNQNNVSGGLRTMAKELAPYMFKQSIKWVKVVNLRSQKPD